MASDAPASPRPGVAGAPPAFIESGGHPPGPPGALLAENLGKPSLWVIIKDLWYQGRRSDGAGGARPAKPFGYCSSTYFHRRVTHLTALRVFRLGAWSAVMLAHLTGRATTSEEPARPPAGSLFAATGERRRRLTMSRHRRRDASYPEAAKRRSYVSPFYESKYWLPEWK